MRDALYSPGQATSERAGLEAAFVSAFLRELRVFLVGVRRDAARAVESPLLLAAAVEPFALANVLGRWAQFSAAVLAQVSRKLPYADDALTRSEYLRGVERRLRDSQLPLSTYEAARAVLAQHAGDPTSTRYAVNRALAKALEAGRGSEWHNQAERIARTEATALHAHNQQTAMDSTAATHKRWVAIRDGRTRPAHAAANGQTVPKDSAFMVGGYAMQGPGDPSAPASLTHNCRCVMVAAAASRGPNRLRRVDAATYDEAFTAAFKDSPYNHHVTIYSRQELEDMTCLLTPDGKAGVAIHDHGDGRVEGTALFNQSGRPGAGASILTEAVAYHGVNYAECFGPYLNRLYESLGFRVFETFPFDPTQAPKGWDYKRFDSPDYHLLRWVGRAVTAAAQDQPRAVLTDKECAALWRAVIEEVNAEATDEQRPYLAEQRKAAETQV